MKKLLVPIIAVLFGLMLSSFTIKDCINVYFIYVSGPQNSRSSYTETNTAQSTATGTIWLYWIRICVEGGTITDAVFDCVFEEIDVVNDSSNTLNDDIEKIVTIDCEIELEIEVQLEKKATP
jgi:hypothetical protein